MSAAAMESQIQSFETIYSMGSKENDRQVEAGINAKWEDAWS
jgi:hypothetical protein